MTESGPVKLISCTPDAEGIIAYCARVSNPSNQGKDGAKLLRYCMRHGHWSPFEMAHMVLEITTTRAISAQILRHRSFSFQEFSQRYAAVQSPPEMPQMRLAGATNRQSSLLLPLDPAQQAACERAETLMQRLHEAYLEMLDRGIANESARAVLPMCTTTRIYMAGSLRSWIHYCQLRTQEDTQAEHRDIAVHCENILKTILPSIYSGGAV